MTKNKRVQQLDLNLLRVFQTLYEEQNMTHTAEALHITPSAVSHAIKRLRIALDDPLFQRSQNKMLPTPACKRMAPLIVENLTRLQQILQQWGHFEPLTSNHHFRIGMHYALEPAILPKITRHLAKFAPNVNFSSIKFERFNLARELASGDLDICLDIMLPIRRPIKRAKIVDINFAVLMRREHPFAKELSAKNYLNAMHVKVSSRATGKTFGDTLFQDLGIDRNVSVRCQNYLAAREIVKNSDQLLTVPTILAQKLLDSELVIQPAPAKLPNSSINLYWHEQTKEDAALKWLRELFSENLSW